MNKEIFKKLKNHKLSLLNKKNVKNGRMNIKLNNINKFTEFGTISKIPKIKSKSTNKLKTKIVNGMNKFPAIKLAINKNKMKVHINNDNNIENVTMNNLKLKNYFQKEDNPKLKIRTNKSFNLKNYHSTQNSNKLLLKNNRDKSYNLKRSQNYIKTNNLNSITNPNIGIIRHLDRKKMKENKSIIFPKHNLKVFKDNKFTNKTLNKSRDKYKLNINKNFRKINNLFEIDVEEKENMNVFSRTNLKTEINIMNKYGKNKEEKFIDIISDISLSEDELNFSEEDSIDNMEFSLDDEEI